MEPATVYVMSDSLGETAASVADAALGQFHKGAFRVVRLPKVRSAAQIEELVTHACGPRCVIFYTFADRGLRAEMTSAVARTDALCVDVLGPGVEALSAVGEFVPSGLVGTIREVDEEYFERIAALEFAVEHDDGRRAEELDQAGVVLIGVSRTSKTPLSMYLAFKGHRVANVPLVPGVDLPKELLEIDSGKVFGLIHDADLLTDIRGRRMANLGGHVRDYADREAVERELEYARGVMRRIGCLVVNTSGKAIEESAQEILRHLR